jgi:hypothetical protein
VLQAKKLKASAGGAAVLTGATTTTKGFDGALLRARAQAEGYARALPAHPSADLHDAALRERLRLLWTEPLALDLSRASARVTRGVAAALARSLTQADLEAHFTVRGRWRLWAGHRRTRQGVGEAVPHERPRHASAAR